MLISICAPCHNRTYDLKKALPTWIEAANASPPVEIVVLDYNSPDDLQEYIETMKDKLTEGNLLKCPKYTERNYYHMAHARNLSVLATSGKYFIQTSTDNLMSLDFITEIRQVLMIDPDIGWITIRNNEGVIVMNKQNFIDAGGYDERFEFYGPEDKDLNLRLVRRGLSVWTLPLCYLHAIKTPNEEKVKGYRLPITKKEMSKLMIPIYYENIDNNVLIANEGKEWGKWTP